MNAQRELRRAARIVGFGAVTGAMLPAFVLHDAMTSKADRASVRDQWVGAWCTALLHLFGVGVLTSGSISASEGGHLVVSNHRSTADILVLLRAFGGHIVSRSDLARWPLVGPAARAVGTLFVDRADAVSGAKAVRTIRSRLSENATIVVFPEGTTFPDDDVRPFHPGAFVAAIHARARVVPVGLAYAAGSGAAFVNETFPAHLARMAAAPPSRVAMCVGAAMSPESGMRPEVLKERAHAEVQRLVGEARRMVDGPLNAQ